MGRDFVRRASGSWKAGLDVRDSGSRRAGLDVKGAGSCGE